MIPCLSDHHKRQVCENVQGTEVFFSSVWIVGSLRAVDNVLVRCVMVLVVESISMSVVGTLTSFRLFGLLVWSEWRNGQFALLFGFYGRGISSGDAITVFRSCFLFVFLPAWRPLDFVGVDLIDGVFLVQTLWFQFCCFFVKFSVVKLIVPTSVPSVMWVLVTRILEIMLRFFGHCSEVDLIYKLIIYFIVWAASPFMVFQYMLLHMLLQLVLQHGMPINTVTCDWYRIGTGSDLTNCRTDVESA